MELNPINTKRLVDSFLRLTEIDSLSFQEREMADYIKKQMEGLGVITCEDDAGSHYHGTAGNLYGCFNGDGSKEPMLFSAHMDTVSPGTDKHAVLQEDGRITSDGTTILGADDLSAVAILLEVVREIQEEGLAHPDIELLFTIAEEAYTLGAAAFDYSKIKAKTAYVLDVSGSVGTISMQEPTLISFEITVKGRAAHAGFEAAKGINAIAIAAKAITKIRQGQIDEQTTFNIGTIQGGEATNIISEQVIVKGEVRSIRHTWAIELVESAIHTFEQVAATYGASVEAHYDIHLKAYTLTEEDPVVVRYGEVCRELGVQVIYKKTFGGSDNNVLIRNGICGAVIANGMQKIHTREEFTSVEELTRAAQIVKKLMTSSD